MTKFEQNSQRCSAYYQNNKKRLQAVSLDRYHVNRESNLAPRKAYQKDILRHRAYAKKREQVDLEFKLLRRLRFRLWKVTKGKSRGALALLGCNLSEFRKHIEEHFERGMTWGNYGVHGWHIDHDVACALFNLTDPAQRKVCFHWTNLKPMWAKENCSKGCRFHQRNSIGP